MSENTKLGLTILAAASVLGLCGDLILRETPWGLNFSLWAIFLFAALFLLARRRNSNPLNDARWLILAAVPFAAGFAWRDSDFLTFLNVVAVLTTLALLTMRAQAIPLRIAGFVKYLWGAVFTALNAVAGVFSLLFIKIKWDEIQSEGWRKNALPIGRGLLIALPIVLLFGGLLMAADAVFEGMVKKIINIEIAEEILKHIFFTGLGAWIAGGILHGIFLSKEIRLPENPLSRSLVIGNTETTIALGLLNLLFLGFVLVQFRYLFGGANLVEITPGLTYAEYARRGFFELVTAAGLVLPMLLGWHWLLPKENPKSKKLFQVLAGAMIALLFVIMFSAVKRMRLYQSEYGLTEQRLYATVFMGWLAAVFVWFGLTVLRNRRERFMFGAVVAGFVAIFALQALNPDNLIVRTNVSLAQTGKEFDVDYPATLSDDALPAIVEALPFLKEAEQKKVFEGVIAPKLASQMSDWRTWSWSRYQAGKALEKYQKPFQNIMNSRYGGDSPILSYSIPF
ncbi:MAG: DUF4173 domain-containing protein [candidate division Zixibacteria bacterium]|nr:DUF4173 domain-containing protein [candidate division Zixibacteria bacterium]